MSYAPTIQSADEDLKRVIYVFPCFEQTRKRMNEVNLIENPDIPLEHDSKNESSEMGSEL